MGIASRLVSTCLGCLVLVGVQSPARCFEMKAGVAKTVITNTEPRVLTNGTKTATVLKDIYARALSLNDGQGRLVIVTYDLNCLDVATPLLRSRVKKELGLDSSRLILLATHNHNGPIQIVPDNFTYGSWLSDTLFNLIQQAIASETGPVKLLFGSGAGAFLRSVSTGPPDVEVQVLKVERGGEPLAVLFNHGTHPIQASSDKVGTGHPGYAMDDIETAIPGVQAMYADASGGDQFVERPPWYLKRLKKARKKGPTVVEETMVRAAQEIGAELAKTVMRVLNADMQDVTGPIRATMDVLALPLAPPISLEKAREFAAKFPEGLGFVPYPDRNRGTNWVRMLLYWYEKGLPFPKTTADMVCTDDTYFVSKTDTAQLERYDYSIHDERPCEYEEIIVARIGPLIFLAMQGEVCAPIGLRIKDTFRSDHPIMAFAYMGEHNLYIPTRELVELKSYQAKVIQSQYASPVGWSPDVGDAMVEGVVNLIRTMVD